MSRATRASKKDGEKAKEADLACDLCDGLFKGTEEVLYCEGSCRKHMHRYCAGVSKYHYLEMKNSSIRRLCTCVLFAPSDSTKLRSRSTIPQR